MGGMEAAKHRATQPSRGQALDKAGSPCDEKAVQIPLVAADRQRSVEVQRLVVLIRCHTDAKSNRPRCKLQHIAALCHGDACLVDIKTPERMRVVAMLRGRCIDAEKAGGYCYAVGGLWSGDG
jgi:hypothetical protein